MVYFEGATGNSEGVWAYSGEQRLIMQSTCDAPGVPVVTTLGAQPVLFTFTKQLNSSYPNTDQLLLDQSVVDQFTVDYVNCKLMFYELFETDESTPYTDTRLSLLLHDTILIESKLFVDVT